jgi:hypothetical protein
VETRLFHPLEHAVHPGALRVSDFTRTNLVIVRSRLSGSEEARLRAGLRPPPKLPVHISCRQLSRRLSDARMREKELNRAIEQARLAVKLGRRQPFPSRIAPTPVPMRPDASPDPAVESLEELADVTFVILTPAPQERIKPRDQFLGSPVLSNILLTLPYLPALSIALMRRSTRPSANR